MNELVEWYLTFASKLRGLEHSTLFGYREVYQKWLQAQIGHIDVNQLTPADIDNSFGTMREAGLSHCRMNNARALLSGSFKWGRRQEKVNNNPTRLRAAYQQ